jgi:hypothetical protein
LTNKKQGRHGLTGVTTPDAYARRRSGTGSPVDANGHPTPTTVSNDTEDRRFQTVSSAGSSAQASGTQMAPSSGGDYRNNIHLHRHCLSDWRHERGPAGERDRYTNKSRRGRWYGAKDPVFIGARNNEIVQET